jgi:hypothetical protein
VEAVPTPTENSLLIAQFGKPGILMPIKPCNLGAGEIAQKMQDLSLVPKKTGPPKPAIRENFTLLPRG